MLTLTKWSQKKEIKNYMLTLTQRNARIKP